MATAYKATEFYDAGESVYNFPFLYLRKEFVKARYDKPDGTIVALTYNRDYSVVGQTLTLTESGVAACETGDRLCIYRETPTDQLVTYADASVLKAYDMNLAEVQLLHLAEENTDYIILHSLSIDLFDNAWEGFGHRLKNIADPKEAQDAVTLHYLNEVDEARIRTMQQIQENMQNLLSQTRASEANARGHAAAAASSETNAAGSATNAAASENHAQTWAEGTDVSVSPLGGEHSSKGWANVAGGHADTARDAMNAANDAADMAGQRAVSALRNAQNAAQNATDAATSATSASQSATSASTSANSASQSATAASTSATRAAGSAASAAQSAQAAARYANSDYAQQAEAAAERAEAAAEGAGGGTGRSADGVLTEVAESLIRPIVESLHECVSQQNTDVQIYMRTNPQNNTKELVVRDGAQYYTAPLTLSTDVNITLEINLPRKYYHQLVTDGNKLSRIENPLRINSEVTSLSGFWQNCSAVQQLVVNIDSTDGYQSGQIKDCVQAMNYLKELRIVSFPDGFFVSDGNYSGMFEQSNNLQEIHVRTDYWVTADRIELSQQMTDMFNSCNHLRAVQFACDSVFATLPTVSFSQMFISCSALIETGCLSSGTGVPRVMFSGILDAARMYSGCHNLVWPMRFEANEGGYISDASAMFEECTALPFVFIKAAVVNGTEMFKNCKCLHGNQPEYVYMDIEPFVAPIGERTENATSMFWGCCSLQEITIPTCPQSPIVATSMFCGCLSLTEIHMSEETALAVTYPEGMFKDCKSLRKAPLLNAKVAAESGTAAKMFMNCTNLIDASNVSFEPISADYINFADAFNGCTSLQKIPLLPRIRGSEGNPLNGASRMFYGCKALPTTFPQVLDFSAWSEGSYVYNRAKRRLQIAVEDSTATSGWSGAKIFGESSVTEVTIKVAPELQPYLTSQLLKGDDTLTIHFIDAEVITDD